MSKKAKQNPVASRQLEYVGLLILKMRTMEGPAFVFTAVDGYSEYAFQLGVEKDDSPNSVLKNIYLLTENSEFVKHMDKGFTLVMESHEELSDRINAIIKPVKGKLMFNKPFNNILTLPLLMSLRKTILKR